VMNRDGLLHVQERDMRRVKTIAQSEEESLRWQAREYANLRHLEREAEAQRKEYGSGVLEIMRSKDVKKIKVDFDEHTDATVSVKTREVAKLDDDKLKKAIGAKAFAKLTTPVVDESKIEAAIKLGELDPNIVESCLDVSEVPYLEARFTKKRRGT
jgi:hypothetical protein